MTTNNPALDIATILQTDGLGSLGTDIFVGMTPEISSLLIAVFDSGGFDPNPKYLREEPTIQCLVKGTPGDYAAASAKALAVKDSLLGRAPTLIGNTDYIRFTQMGDILHLGVDEKNRHIFTSNWHLVREMQSGGHRIPL